MSSSIVQIEQSILDTLRSLYHSIVVTGAQTTTTDNSTGTYTDNLTGEVITLKYLIWQYPISDFSSEVYMRTSHRAKHIKNKEGQINMDFILSPDESTWFDSEIKNKASEVMRILAPWTKNLPSAFLFNESPDIETWEVKAWVVGDYVRYSDNKIYLCILDANAELPTNTTYWEVQPDWIDSTDKITFLLNLPDYFNDNYATSLDGFISALIRDLILTDWYQICGLSQDWQLYKLAVEDGISNVKQSFLQRTKLITAPNRYY